MPAHYFTSSTLTECLLAPTRSMPSSRSSRVVKATLYTQKGTCCTSSSIHKAIKAATAPSVRPGSPTSANPAQVPARLMRSSLHNPCHHAGLGCIVMCGTMGHHQHRPQSTRELQVPKQKLMQHKKPRVCFALKPGPNKQRQSVAPHKSKQQAAAQATASEHELPTEPFQSQVLAGTSPQEACKVLGSGPGSRLCLHCPVQRLPSRASGACVCYKLDGLSSSPDGSRTLGCVT